MKIVADDAIPWLDEAFGELGDVARVPGGALDADTVRDADALLTRSVTQVDEALLRGSTIRFVGCATAGVDHVDSSALAHLGITFAHAPGCNAQGVVEFVFAEILAAAVSRGSDWLHGGAVGVVGFGQIGHRLVALLRSLGLEVLVNDPPLQHEHAAHPEPFVPLAELLSRATIVTFHVPKVSSGPWPTPHLLDERGLARLPDDALVINTSRGDVVDNHALCRWLEADRGNAVLDVWEHEPDLDPMMLRMPSIVRATPHIAGYTVEGKARGTAMIHAALCQHLERAPSFSTSQVIGAPLSACAPTGTSDIQWLAALLRGAHDFATIDASLRSLADGPSAGLPTAFELLRKGYRLRHEVSHWRRPTIPDLGQPTLPGSVARALDRLFPAIA